MPEAESARPGTHDKFAMVDGDGLECEAVR
jgi:hypothetical protein